MTRQLVKESLRLLAGEPPDPSLRLGEHLDLRHRVAPPPLISRLPEDGTGQSEVAVDRSIRGTLVQLGLTDLADYIRPYVVKECVPEDAV